MIALLWLANISRCISPTLCPSDGELITAVSARDDADVRAISNNATANEQIVFVHPRSVQGISDVICGDRLPGDDPTITCKFTVRYRDKDTYQVARLVKHDERWTIDDELIVTRRK